MGQSTGRYYRNLVERDGPHCAWCGVETLAHGFSPGHPENQRVGTFDHVIPRMAGGSGAMANGIIACKRCNEERGCLPFDVYHWRARNPNDDLLFAAWCRALMHASERARGPLRRQFRWSTIADAVPPDVREKLMALA